MAKSLDHEAVADIRHDKLLEFEEVTNGYRDKSLEGKM